MRLRCARPEPAENFPEALLLLSVAPESFMWPMKTKPPQREAKRKPLRRGGVGGRRQLNLLRV